MADGVRNVLANHARIAVLDADCDRLHRLLAEIAEAGHTALGLSDASLAGTVFASTRYDLLLIAECPGWHAGAFVQWLREQLGDAAPICVRMRPRSMVSSPPGASSLDTVVELPATSSALVELLVRALRRSPERSGVFSDQPTEPELSVALGVRAVC